MLTGNGLKLGLILCLGLVTSLASAAPANDAFANATTITGAFGTISGSNVEATMEAGEPDLMNDTDGFAGVDKSVWYQWTAPADGVLTLDTFGSDFDTVLAVYTNSLDAANLVAVNDSFVMMFVPQSRVAFKVTAGTTYYISVSGAVASTPGYSDEGNIVLNWSEAVPSIKSGTFQFTADIYTVSEDENNPAALGPPDMNNVPSIQGARVTVTRTDGSSGRVYVPYTVTAIDASQAEADTTGVLVFDDYQMSADIFVPVFTVPPTNSGTGTNAIQFAPPAQISVTLDTPYLDELESPDLIPPMVGDLTDATVQVLSKQYGSSALDRATLLPFFNLERATYRCRRTQGTAVVWVYPSTAGPFTVQYALSKHVSLTSMNGPNNTFQLQAGSDYATADSDFTDISGGTLSWGTGDATPKAINIPILDTTNAQFNEDLEIELFNPRNGSALLALGQVDKATLTILFDKQPAGAVDRTWNMEDNPYSNPPYLTYPGTQGGVSDGANGNGGTVYATVAQPDGKTLIAGSFISFDSRPYNRIVRLLSDGYYDPTFMVSPNSGANDFIATMALQPDGKILIGGNFTSFNGINRYRIARLNSDGTLDSSFNPGTGADGKVWALALQSDGRIVIGGEFTSFNGTNCNYIARLNADGSLDTTFSPPEPLNGPVYALALPVSSTFNVDRTASGGAPEDVFPINLGSANAGTLTITYDFLFVPDRMKVFYGDTNTITGTGVLVWDSGLTNNPFGPVQVVIPFGPTNGLTTNRITIVMNQGNGDPDTAWDYSASVKTASGFSQICAGGAFNQVGDATFGGVVRYNQDGTLDSTFNPGIGTYNINSGYTDPVKSLALQSDGKLLVGGGFSYLQMVPVNGLARLNLDGSVDTSFATAGELNGTFNPVTKIADTVNSILVQPDGTFYIGGDFTTINQTRRVGLARMFADGSLDTSFMDTAYNQFAGLINHYHNPDAINPDDYPMGNNRNAVYAIAVEPAGGVIIGGNFLRVGGGSYGHSGAVNDTIVGGIYGLDDYLANGNELSYNGRMDIHPRSNVARLIGGTTMGPGNLQFTYDSYTVDKSGNSLFVSLVRTNGDLGTISASFYSPTGAVGQAGIAVEGTDFDIGNMEPTWATMWSASWMKSDGFTGQNYVPSAGNEAFETLTIYNNTNLSGNVNANFALTAPKGTNFTLGGEYIPLGAALGSLLAAPVTIIDNNFPPGTFSFSSPTYTVNQTSNYVDITVVRTNGFKGRVQLNYAAFNGTATSPANYTSTNGVLTFNEGVASQTFRVQIVPTTVNGPDKTVNLTLYGLTGGGRPGLTNAVLTIVNNVFGAGHVAFAQATNGVNETAGTASIVLNRLGASSGTLQVTAITSDGSAVNGVNYVGSTNVVLWNDKEVLPKTITIPVKHDGIFTSNLTVNIRLTNGLVNGFSNSSILGLSTVTNSTLVITNTDFPGAVQFSSGAYSVKKYGGFALIPVNRIGGSAGTVTVGYSTVNGTALSGVNYTSTSGLLTFTNGVVSQYFKVPIMDSTNNGLLSLGLVLSNATVLGSPLPWVAQGSPSNAVLNIIDTDSVGETPGSVDSTYDQFASFNGNVFALALQANNYLLAAGDFTMANGVPRQRIVRLNANGGLDNSFLSPSSSMGANAQIRSLAIQQDGRILVGGVFTNFNSVVMNRLARLNYDGSLDSTFISGLGSGADSSVYAVAQSPVDGKILVAGAFARLDGVTFNGVGRLNTDGKPDTTFNPGGLGANDTVYALAVQTDGKVIIGGDFTAVNGVSRNRLARLNTDGSLDNTFNIGTGLNDSVRAITLQADGGILIGGLFTTNNGVAMNRIARLNTDGSLDTSFTPGAGANDMVTSIAIQKDNRIIVGGQFTRCSDVYRSRLTRLNPDGTVDPTINFGTGANDFVAAVVVQQGSIQGYPADVPDEKIIIGGGFTQFNGKNCGHLARIFGGSIGGVGTFQFSAPTYQIAENSPISAVITVTRAGGTSGTNANGSGDIFVPFATSNLTAVAGVNYQSVVTNLIFPMGEVQRTVEIPVLDDGVITSNLTVALSISPTDSKQVGDQPTAVLTIVNVDSSVAFASATYQVPKNVVNGVAAISIARQGSTAGTATVMFHTTTNGTAVAGIDYDPVTNSVVTFPAGATNMVVTIPVINNGLPRGNRTVALELTNAANTTIYAPSNATLTIIDTVFAPGVLSFLTTNIVVNEGNTTAQLTVVRTDGSSGAVSVSYTTTAGSALPGVNYLTSSGTVTFGDGVTNRDISIPLLDNSIVQGTVNFTVNLLNPTGGATLGIGKNATVAIEDDEIGLNFVSATNTVPENNGFVAVLVQRLGRTNSTVSANYSTVNGTALAGINYSNTFGVLNFSIGETLKSITIPLIENTNATGDLTFGVRLTAPSGAQLVAPSNTVVVIQDIETGISFTTNYTRVLKSIGQAVLPVICANPALQPVLLTSNDVPLQVSYFTVDGTAKAGVDYQPATGTLVFTNGIVTNNIAVTIYNNNYLTGDRTFSVLLTNVTAPGRISPYATNALIIAESNTGISFDRAGYSAFENGVFATINVIRTGYTDSVASVNFMTTNGTALAGVNYAPTNGVIVLTNGVTSGSFRVPLIANPVVQPNLTAQLLLGSPTNALLVSPYVSTLTILESGGSFVMPAGAQVVTNYTSGKPDGIINSNDTVQVLFAFRNASGLNVTNLIAYLKATNGVVSPSPTSQTYGALQVYGHSVSRTFSFTARGTNAQAFYPTFDLYDNAKFLGTVAFTFTLGSWTNVYANTNYITINDNTNASPYPSVITVSGAGSSILSAVVTFTNLSHTSPGDIAALVVSPSQSNTLVMAHAGAQNKVTGITIKFDDAASNSLPSSVASPNTVITNGTYKPSGYLPLKNFP